MAEFKKISELDRAESVIDTDLFIVETLTGTKAITRAKLREETESVNPEDIGLGNVDNTSDIDKPVSTATQLALDLKADITYVEDTYLSQQNASTLYETKNNASGVYLSKVDALQYYVTKENANTTYATQESLNNYTTKGEFETELQSIANTYTTKEEFNTALSDIETLLQGV